MPSYAQLPDGTVLVTADDGTQRVVAQDGSDLGPFAGAASDPSLADPGLMDAGSWGPPATNPYAPPPVAAPVMPPIPAPSYGGSYGLSGTGPYDVAGVPVPGSSGASNLAAMQGWQQHWTQSAEDGYPSGGSGYRKDARVPGGASAGGWGAASAPSVSSGGGSSGGGYSPAASGGGGSGQSAASSLYWQMRDKLVGNLTGGSSGYSSSSGSYQYPDPTTPWAPYASYDPNQKRHGVNATQAVGLYYQPQMMLPKAAPGMSPLGAAYGLASQLPATQLAFLSSGGKKSWGGTPLDLAGSLNHLYAGVDAGKLPSQQSMLHNLANPANGSGLDLLFKGQPVATQATNYLPLIQAVAQTTMPDLTAGATTAYASWLLNRIGSKHLGDHVKVDDYGHPAGGGGFQLNRAVTRRIMR